MRFLELGAPKACLAPFPLGIARVASPSATRRLVSGVLRTLKQRHFPPVAYLSYRRRTQRGGPIGQPAHRSRQSAVKSPVSRTTPSKSFCLIKIESTAIISHQHFTAHRGGGSTIIPSPRSMDLTLGASGPRSSVRKNPGLFVTCECANVLDRSLIAGLFSLFRKVSHFCFRLETVDFSTSCF